LLISPDTKPEQAKRFQKFKDLRANWTLASHRKSADAELQQAADLDA